MKSHHCSSINWTCIKTISCLAISSNDVDVRNELCCQQELIVILQLKQSLSGCLHKTKHANLDAHSHASFIEKPHMDVSQASKTALLRIRKSPITPFANSPEPTKAEQFKLQLSSRPKI